MPENRKNDTKLCLIREIRKSHPSIIAVMNYRKFLIFPSLASTKTFATHLAIHLRKAYFENFTSSAHKLHRVLSSENNSFVSWISPLLVLLLLLFHKWPFVLIYFHCSFFPLFLLKIIVFFSISPYLFSFPFDMQLVWMLLYPVEVWIISYACSVDLLLILHFWEFFNLQKAWKSRDGGCKQWISWKIKNAISANIFIRKKWYFAKNMFPKQF